MSNQQEANLVRGIRKWDLTAVAINGIIGAGIFGLPSDAYRLTSSYSLLAFAACALVVSLLILCFAEVGSRFNTTGGPYLYAREAFGPAIGFEVGWMMWLARLTAFAANCNLLVGYLSYFFPAVAGGWQRAAVIITVVVLLTTTNLLGVRDAAVLSNIFTIGKLIPIILFIAVGFFFINPQNYSTTTLPGYGEFSSAVMLLVYAFTGFEMAVIPAGEVTDPRKNLPMAILLAIAVVAVLYISIQAVCIGTLPGLAASRRPLADASLSFFGPAGASIISAGAVISIVGNLNVIILAGSRLPFAMAEREELPRLLARTHRRFRTPYLAILLSAGIMLVLTLYRSFIEAVAISTVARLLAYAGTCAALPVLRRRPEVPPASFYLKGGVVIAAGTLALSLWLLSRAQWREARDAAVAALIGLLIFAAYRLSNRRRRKNEVNRTEI